MDERVEARVRELGLLPHPEGGFFRETYRSDVVLPALEGYPGSRIAVTSILFLLPSGSRSRWHRVRSEELWLFHEGDALTLRTKAALDDDGAETHVLSRSNLQAFVPAGHWQDAEVPPGEAGYALVGCVVAPGFEFDDFEVVDA